MIETHTKYNRLKVANYIEDGNFHLFHSNNNFISYNLIGLNVTLYKVKNPKDQDLYFIINQYKTTIRATGEEEDFKFPHKYYYSSVLEIKFKNSIFAEMFVKLKTDLQKTIKMLDDDKTEKKLGKEKLSKLRNRRGSYKGYLNKSEATKKRVMHSLSHMFAKQVADAISIDIESIHQKYQLEPPVIYLGDYDNTGFNENLSENLVDTIHKGSISVRSCTCKTACEKCLLFSTN